MSKKGSVFQKGGGGTNFEQAVQTAFLTTLLIRGAAPSIPANEVTEVAFQVTNRGYETDDLLIIAKSNLGTHRLLGQIKYNLTFSSNNDTFNEVIKSFWLDFNNISCFDKNMDKLLLIKSSLTKDERNHLKSILSWAKTHATVEDYISEVQRVGGKQKYLDVLIKSLTIANNGIPLPNQQLWEFVKCLDVVEYDFLQGSSIAKTYFLNLLKISKSEICTLNEDEIWNTLFAYVANYNKYGGSIDLKSVQGLPFYQYFDTTKLSPHFQSIEKLKADSEIVFKSIKNTINCYHLSRKSTIEDIFEAVNSGQITLIVGKPGVGKTAIVKDLLHYHYTNSTYFIFKADELNAVHLPQMLHQHSVNESIQDIFSCISLIPDKIIIVDSMEKLLEGDPDSAFKQLLQVIEEYPDIKIIGTIRKYAVDLIHQKFDLESQKVTIKTIPVLEENEQIKIINEFPQIEGVFKNDKIKSLLKIPKYLDFIITAISKSSVDFSDINLTGFKSNLWNILVKNVAVRKNGLPAKREKAFVDITLSRAKAMKLFVQPNTADEEAVDYLEDDEIIVQENQSGRYSPAHDILEDWALTRHITAVYESSVSSEIFFQSIGDEPAIRRAFRLWVSDNLVDDSNKIISLLEKTLANNQIKNYWADELLVAIFKSQECKDIFVYFEKELLAENAKLLVRCIGLLRTACKINNEKLSALVPIGSGWSEIVFFIKKHIVNIDNLSSLICDLLIEWEDKLYDNVAVAENEKIVVRDIILHFINKVEKGEEKWFRAPLGDNHVSMIRLLFHIADIARDEISLLIKRAENKEGNNKWRTRGFYEKVIETTLSGLNVWHLSRELPNLIIQIAWSQWKLPLRKVEDENGYPTNYRYSLRQEEYWGIQDRHQFFPPGVFKTPAYNLLRNHTFKGLKFITEFINYSIEFYVKTDFEHKQKLEQITFKLKSGKSVQQWGNAALWLAYRGTSVTNYAIECLLMSLEKYIIDLVQVKTEIAQKNVSFIFTYLLENSNNVATTSVLASVMMAYPKEIDVVAIPILSVKEFYDWDSERAFRENSALSPMDSRISFAQEVRHKSNQLLHRKKYQFGLKSFVIDYQFNIRILNREIHQSFDELKTTAKDIYWRKMLNEVDVRNWKVSETEQNKENRRIIVQPQLEPDVLEHFEPFQKEQEEKSKAYNDAWLLAKVYEEKEKLIFEDWERIYNIYIQKEQFDSMRDRPITLAFIGLNIFSKELNAIQKTWCMDLLSDALTVRIGNKFNLNIDFLLEPKYNPMEREIAINSFHLLIENVESINKKNELIILIIYTLFAPFANYEIVEIIMYFRETFYRKQPEVFKLIWHGLIEYSQFRKENPYYYDSLQQENLAKKRKKEANFIDSFIIAGSKKTLQIETINLANTEGYLIARAAILTPFDGKPIYTKFLNHFIQLLEQDFRKKDKYGHNPSEETRAVHYEYVHSFREYLIQLFLYANSDLSKNILDLIIASIHRKDFNLRDSYDYLKHVEGILTGIIIKLDQTTFGEENSLESQVLINNFWVLWKHLFQKILEAECYYLVSPLLLNIAWNKDVRIWKVVEDKKDFYREVIKKVGQYSHIGVVNLLSSCGEKLLLPDGLNWLVEILKENQFSDDVYTHLHTEKLINRLFLYHISLIKKDASLITNFIWLLNKMVDAGSSKAYVIRENVIIYKTDM